MSVSHLLHTKRPSYLRAFLDKFGNVEGEVLDRLIELNVVLPGGGRPVRANVIHPAFDRRLGNRNQEQRGKKDRNVPETDSTDHREIARQPDHAVAHMLGGRDTLDGRCEVYPLLLVIEIGTLRYDKSIQNRIVKRRRFMHIDVVGFLAPTERGPRPQLLLKLQDRLDRMYIDKLDGGVSQDQFELMSESFRKEQSDLLQHIETRQQANQTYLDEGVHLLELAQKAVVLYEKQDMREKRRLLDFVCSNSQWRDGRLIPTYRKPFDLLASTNMAYTKTKAASPRENGFCPVWLPGPDSNQRPIG